MLPPAIHFLTNYDSSHFNILLRARDYYRFVSFVLLGVALAVPAIFCHALFRNRLIRLSMDTANVADDLLTQMFHNSRKQAAVIATSAMAIVTSGTAVRHMPVRQPVSGPDPVPRSGNLGIGAPP